MVRGIDWSVLHCRSPLCLLNTKYTFWLAKNTFAVNMAGIAQSMSVLARRLSRQSPLVVAGGGEALARAAGGASYKLLHTSSPTHAGYVGFFFL